VYGRNSIGEQNFMLTRAVLGSSRTNGHEWFVKGMASEPVLSEVEGCHNSSRRKSALAAKLLFNRFVRDFVAAWTKVMNLDRFDLKKN
jgi:hypothetical protein